MTIAILILLLSFAFFMSLSLLFPPGEPYDTLSVALCYWPVIYYLHKVSRFELAKELDKPSVIECGSGLLAVYLIFFLIAAVRHFYSGITSPSSTISLESLKYIIHLPFACIVIPVSEEIIFRYYFFSILKNRFGVLIGYIVSIGLFAGVHYFNPITPVLIFQGFIFTYVYQRTNVIFMSIFLHILNNSVMHFIEYITL